MSFECREDDGRINNTISISLSMKRIKEYEKAQEGSEIMFILFVLETTENISII